MKAIYISALEQDVYYDIGKNAQHNFDLIDNANSDDIWFHINNAPSTHIIAHTAGLNLNKKQLRQIIKSGALLCKQSSKYKSVNNVEIIYTQIKNITKQKTVGSVTTINAKTIII